MSYGDTNSMDYHYASQASELPTVRSSFFLWNCNRQPRLEIRSLLASLILAWLVPWHHFFARGCKLMVSPLFLPLGPEHTGHFVQPHVAAHCGGDIYSRRKPLFSSFGEHTAVCGSSVPQAVARPRHRQSVCIHNIHVAATCRPSVLGSATMRGHMWLNKVASVLGPLNWWQTVLLHHSPLPIT